MNTRVAKLVAYALVLASMGAMSWGARSLARFGLHGHRGTKIYYDAFHCARHRWDQDNRRDVTAYQSVSGYARLLQAWREAGFDVHVGTESFDRETLDDYDVFFVGEQTFHARFMSAREREDLMDWVESGGGLFITAEHTNAYYMAETFNRVVSELPLRVRPDTLAERGPTGRAVDWVDLSDAVAHPVNAGVDEYRFYAGASLDTPHGIVFSSATSWSDRYDATKWPLHHSNGARDEGELAGPLAGIAAFDHGEGRVVAMGDHNALANDTLYWGDHHRFALNAVSWLAPARINPDLAWLAAGLALLLAGIRLLRTGPLARDAPWGRIGATVGVAALGLTAWMWGQRPPEGFFVHVGRQSAIAFMSNAPSDYYTFYGQLTKEPDSRPWSSRELSPGHQALFLSAPTEAFTEAELGIIDGYLARGKTVVYVASLESLDSSAGRQLQAAYAFGVELDRDLALAEGVTPFLVKGSPRLVTGIHRVYVDGGLPGLTTQGLEPVVQLSPGAFHPKEEAWRTDDVAFDLVSQKEVGGGRFVLFAPAELFDNQSLGDLYVDPDPIQGQMRELVIRVAQEALDE